VNLVESIRTALRVPAEPRLELFVTHILKDGVTFHLQGEAVDWWFIPHLALVRLRQEFAGLEDKLSVTDLDAAMWSQDADKRERAREVMARLARSMSHDDWETAAL
jgi:serine/threonine protein kinase HipA of HipAB toxin-antitoxin module